MLNFYFIFIFLFLFNIFYCTLGSGVHVQNMQDCCIGTYMAMWFAVSIPPSPISGTSPHVIPPQLPNPRCPSPGSPQQTSVYHAPLPVSIVQHPPMSENMQYLIFCSCVSLLRVMVSRFIHVPTKDTNSSFLMAA